MVVVHAQEMALRVAMAEQARLQHLVGRKTDAGTTLAGLNVRRSMSAK